MKVENTLSLFEVQSILDVGCSCSVHSGRFRPLESYRSALRSDVVLISVRSCLFRFEIYFKALLIKSDNS